MSRKVDVYHAWKDIWDDNKGEEENKYLQITITNNK